MKQTIFSTCSGALSLPILNLLPLLFFLLHPIPSSCTDPYYYNCTNPEAKTCGDDQLIRFPFFIQGKQDSFCGFPGFNLTCNTNGQPILKLGDTNFVIRQINYIEQSIRVSNAVVSDTNSSCIPLLSNVSFPEEKFQFPASNQPNDDLFLLYNCNYSGTDNLDKYELGCSSLSDATLAVFGGDSLLGNASSKCGKSVKVPVDRDGSGEDDQGEVVELVRKGFVLNWVGSNCSECEESGGRCGFDGSNYFVKCFCPDRPHSRSCKGKKNLGLPLGLGIGNGVLLMIIVSYVFWRYRKRKRASSKLLSVNSSSDPSLKDDLERGTMYFGVPVFSYHELEVATSNFSSENEIGDGGFGIVYYGKLGDGREVAVKRMYEHNYRRVEQFMNEIKILTRMRHKNLVSLYGCTSHRSKELLLVYEYISNGTVADHLHGDRAKDRPLTWPTRMSIAIETASALAYLHASDIIHRDVKTNNMLLDDNCSVKVADFGLSRLFPSDRTHVSTAPQGTPGYVDPEYHQCYQLTDKSDVYSFGVVLVELISSMPAVDISRAWSDINLANLAVRKITECAVVELIDPWLDHKKNTEIKCLATSVAELALRCLQLEKDMRPTMVEVLEELIKIKNQHSKCNQEEGHDKKTIPTPTSPDQEHDDQDSPLKNVCHLPSPIAVTDKWVSSSSTATTSDTNG